jgi:osmoprotectant transport system permease protein
VILVRNLIAGFDAVPAEVLEAADGMGYAGAQRLWRVELPIALPIIIAGLRVATVTTMGLVTIAALIGRGGLGYLIVNIGINQRFPTATITGVVLVVALSALFDWSLALLQRRLTPWAAVRAA